MEDNFTDQLKQEVNNIQSWDELTRGTDTNQGKQIIPAIWQATTTVQPVSRKQAPGH